MIVLPSRGRPDSLRQFFEVSQPVVRGVVMLDQDDAGQYANLPLPSHWSILIGPRIGYVAMLNQAFLLYPDEPFYAYGGDDIRCGPAGWDTHLAAVATEGKIAFGNDLINGVRRCCLPFICGDLVRKVGWLGYPGLKHLYCDTVWRDIGAALNILHYCPDLITEHLHWSTGKQPYDQTAQERQTQGDAAVYQDFLVRELKETVNRCNS